MVLSCARWSTIPPRSCPRHSSNDSTRIDAQLAESERIRVFKAEKAALQAKKADLLAKRESSAKT